MEDVSEEVDLCAFNKLRGEEVKGHGLHILSGFSIFDLDR